MNIGDVANDFDYLTALATTRSVDGCLILTKTRGFGVFLSSRLQSTTSKTKRETPNCR